MDLKIFATEPDIPITTQQSDENLLLVQLIKVKDSSFASKYAKRQFSLPTNNFIQTDAGTISLSAWTGSSFDGNPNGFKLGSAYSKSSVTRNLSCCLAFDESKKFLTTTIARLLVTLITVCL